MIGSSFKCGRCGSSRGAALVEYVIIGHFIGILSILGVTFFGDNVRAVFATADNSLAATDSTPATRRASPAAIYGSQDRAVTAAIGKALSAPTSKRSLRGDWMPVASTQSEASFGGGRFIKTGYLDDANAGRRVKTSALFGTVLADVTDAQTLKLCQEGDVTGCLNAIKRTLRMDAHEMHILDQEKLVEKLEGGFAIALDEGAEDHASTFEALQQEVESRAESLCDIIYGSSDWQTLYTPKMVGIAERESDPTPAIYRLPNGRIKVLIYDARTGATKWLTASPKSRMLLFTHLTCMNPAD